MCEIFGNFLDMPRKEGDDEMGGLIGGGSPRN